MSLLVAKGFCKKVMLGEKDNRKPGYKYTLDETLGNLED